MRGWTAVLIAGLIAAAPASAQRRMEKLGRGVVAVPRDAGGVYVGWRLLGTDPDGIAFNVYRVTGGAARKLNDKPLTGGTNFVDRSVDRARANAYHVRPVIGGREQPASAAFTLPANAPAKQYLSVPLRPLDGYAVHHAWVGDLDGDGEYDFVVDRVPAAAGTPKLEGYRRDGTFLWRVDMGPNSIARIDPNDPAPASISGASNLAGFRDNDNVTVYDLDGDDRAEVLVRTAGGVIFGDGKTLASADPSVQFVSVIDGGTGAERTRTALPRDYAATGPLSGHFGVAYLDGKKPSLIAKLKNRGAGRTFPLMICAYDLAGDKLTLRWQWKRTDENASDFHQIRILDVDGDGRDEVCDGNYVVDDDGRFLYGLPGVIHGDRYHIGDLDPDRPGLEGFGVQQDNPSRLGWYYYDAAKGTLLREHYLDKVADIGRGTAADIDPRHRGYEYWAVGGVFNAPSGKKISEAQPVPNFRIWWDGDVLAEILDRTSVLKWNLRTGATASLLSAERDGAIHSWRNAPPFYGDILGDWREEILFESADHTKLLIYTTTIPTDVRLYTLPHNPAYRAGMAIHGYMQSHMVDYYLGHGMSPPPRPNIRTK